MEPFTHQQCTGYEHAPNRTVRRLAITALRALERLDAQGAELRDLQERLAAHEINRQDYLLVLLYGDGTVELWSADWRPAKFAHVPSLADDVQARQWAVRGLPRCYAELVLTDKGKVVAFDSTAGCLTGEAFERVGQRLEQLAVIEAIKELAKPA